MMLYNIAKPEKLFDKLDGLTGHVEMVMLDGNAFDWKEEGKLVKSLWTAVPKAPVDHVELRLDNREDTRDMLDFLIRGNLA
jgi:3-mercaptopyruvate sulfurtransferase SseA